MATANAITSKQHNWFERLVIFYLEHYGSKHIKRVIFFGSLFPYALQLERLKRDVMTKLNHHMGIALNSSTLLFPGMFRNLVWGQKGLEDAIRPEDIKRDITDERAEEIARLIVSRTPQCIVYDTTEKMVRDVQYMFVHGDQLAPA